MAGARTAERWWYEAVTPLLPVAGVLGLVVGSFLSVVIHRVPREESLLRPLVLRGRCTDCGQRISARYPLVELGTALLFVAVTVRFGLSPALPAYLYLAAIAIALAMIDFDVRRLPDVIVLPSYLVGALLLVPAAAAHADWSAAGRGLVAMAVLLAFYVALASLHPGGMGFGDVKLAGLLGLYLGWLGWSSVWIGTLAGFLLGGLAGAVLVVTRRATRKTPIPFGPYMLAGAMLAVLVSGP